MLEEARVPTVSSLMEASGFQVMATPLLAGMVPPPQTPLRHWSPWLQDEAVVPRAQKPPTQEPERQSASAVQILPPKQGPQSGPPQSTSVSPPFWVASAQPAQRLRL